jgi:hypothetical protein
LRLTLRKGATLRGRIVDDLDQPVAKAKIRASNAGSEPRFEWRAVTDEQGRFEWLSAPPRLAYNVSAAGYVEESNVQLAGDGSEQVVTLRGNAGPSRSFHISGTAVDSETGKPIESFRVLTVTTWDDLSSSSSPEVQVVGTQGKFSFNADGSVRQYILEVQAKGYLPARLTLDGPITNDSLVAFELNRGAPVTGRVQLPNGTLAVDALVMLSAVQAHQLSPFPTQMETVYMRLPGQFDLVRSQGSRTSTDAEGCFSFEPKLGMKRILVAHKDGFAEVPVNQLTTSPTVVLQPWGRVAGMLRVGNQPGTNGTLYLRNWGWAHTFSPSLQINLEAKTDSAGRFAIEGVPPGEWQISHEVSLRIGSADAIELKPVKIQSSHGYSMILPPRSAPSLVQLIRVEAGQTTEVSLGGVGRMLVGRAKPVALGQPLDWQRDVQRLTSKASWPAVGPPPRRGEFASEQEYVSAQQQWNARAREFWLSEAGIQARSVARDYVLVFKPDGSFHIDDVLPGAYDLNIHVTDPSIPDSFFRGKAIGTLTKEIIVPDAPGATTAEPFDLGVLDLSVGDR